MASTTSFAQRRAHLGRRQTTIGLVELVKRTASPTRHIRYVSACVSPSPSPPFESSSSRGRSASVSRGPLFPSTHSSNSPVSRAISPARGMSPVPRLSPLPSPRTMSPQPVSPFMQHHPPSPFSRTPPRSPIISAALGPPSSPSKFTLDDQSNSPLMFTSPWSSSPLVQSTLPPPPMLSQPPPPPPPLKSKLSVLYPLIKEPTVPHHRAAREPVQMACETTQYLHILRAYLPDYNPDEVTIAVSHNDATQHDALRIIADRWQSEDNCRHEWNITFEPHDTNMASVHAGFSPDSWLQITVRRFSDAERRASSYIKPHRALKFCYATYAQ